MKPIMMIIFTLAIVSLRAQNNNRLKLRLEIETWRNTIAVSHVIYGRTTGAGETKVYKAFKKLVELASIAELKMLANDKNAIVKGYAFWALLLKNRKEAQLIKSKFRFSFKKIYLRLYGCVGNRCRLKDFVNFIDNLPDD